MTETVHLTDDEAKLVRVLLRVDTEYDPSSLLEGSRLRLNWTQAQDVMQVLATHMTKAMADAHEADAYDGLDIQYERVQSVNQKILDEFRGKV